MKFSKGSGRLWVRSIHGRKWHLVYDVGDYESATFCDITLYLHKSDSVFHTDPPDKNKCKRCLRVMEKED